MLTDSKLRAQVDELWDRLWTGGLTNPLDAIEQFSYLLFLKRLDESEAEKERTAQFLGQPYQSSLPEEMRWRTWTKYQAADALKHLKEKVFPQFRILGAAESSFTEYMQNAECKINRGSLLIEACNLIDQMRISEQNQDVQGDLYEYLLSHLNTAGRNGQFRTPRHIIQMMVEMIDPRPRERIGDLAAGTAGFLVNAYQHILRRATSPDISELIGDKLSQDERHFLQSQAFRGYDNDSGMTMLRIGSMNLMLHGLAQPRFFYADTLSDDFKESAEYEVILMNPPFKGKVNPKEVSDSLPDNTGKSELLFVHLILRALDMGGRCAVIVPDGVLFGSSTAHVELRKKLIEQNRLDGVVSMPGGVFKPYAGVSTAVLLFTKGASTERIWFYDMAHDGFSLDDKRQPTAENDIPDLLTCWQKRHNPDFAAARQSRLAELQAKLTPLKADRLAHQARINRLTFESVIAPESPPSNSPQRGEDSLASPPLGGTEGGPSIHADLSRAQTELAELEAQIAPLQAEVDQLTRQFWVDKKTVKANKYDLSASRYRQVEPDEAYHENPQVTMQRLLTLERVMRGEVEALEVLLR